MKAYNAILELTELQLKQLHDWADGQYPEPPGVIYEVARQAAVGIARVFYPQVGQWAYYDGKPTKILAETSTRGVYAVEVYDSADSDRYAFMKVDQKELSEYSA